MFEVITERNHVYLFHTLEQVRAWADRNPNVGFSAGPGNAPRDKIKWTVPQAFGLVPSFEEVPGGNPF